MKDTGQILRSIVPDTKIYCEVCKVSKVEDLTCDVALVSHPDVTIEKVRLKAHLNGDESMIIKPKNDSFVLVAFLSQTDAFIAMYDQVDEVSIKIEETTIKIDKDGIILNGGENKGLTITPELKNQLAKMTARIDGAFNLLEQATSAALHPNTAVWGPLYKGIVDPLVKEDFSNIEDTKVKH